MECLVQGSPGHTALEWQLGCDPRQQTKMAADEVPASGSTDGGSHHGPKGSHQSLQHAPTGHRWSHSGVRLEAGTAQDFGAGGAGLPC